MKKLLEYTYETDSCALKYSKKKHNGKKCIIINGLADLHDTVIIPKEIGGIPVKIIRSHAFYNTDIKHVILPEGLEEIEDRAFASCTLLEEINFPSTLKHIGNEAFVYCERLKSIILNEGLTNLSEGVFRSCSGLENVSFPESLIKIDSEAFRYTKIKNIRFNSNLKEISKSAFEDCDSLENVEFNEGLECIGEYAFNTDCSLTKIILPESLITLGYNAFNSCSSLQTFYIGKNLANITEQDFLYNSENLREIKVNPDNRFFRDIDGVLYDCNLKMLIRVPPCLENKTLDIPILVNRFAEHCFSGVDLEKVIIRSKSIRGISDSCVGRIENICCIPNSDVDKQIRDYWDVNPTPIQSTLDIFLKELDDEKVK